MSDMALSIPFLIYITQLHNFKLKNYSCFDENMIILLRNVPKEPIFPSIRVVNTIFETFL